MDSVVSGVASKVAEYTFGVIITGIEYVIYVDENVQNLKDQVTKLEDLRERVQHSVYGAIRNAEKIEDDVQTWLANVHKKLSEYDRDKLEQDEEKAKKKCFIGLCPNFKSRYQLSKKAVEEAKAIVKLLGEGKFDKVSYSPAMKGVVTKGYKAFESRTNALEGIMAVLRASSVRIVGIHGMAGVGKTTLAREVADRVKEEHLFDEVAFATVSDNPDTRKIQGEIGDMLGLHYKAETVIGRAAQLSERLRTDKSKAKTEKSETYSTDKSEGLNTDKRIIIVLDNLWQKLDLDEVGISFQDEAAQKSSTARCKLLLTSRYLEVLNDMNVEKNFKLELLSQPESMNLFAETVGNDRVRKSKSIADELVKKCQGLPVAILAIANALKAKDVLSWDDALRQLQ